MNSQDHYDRQIAPPGSDLYYSVLKIPAKKRQTIVFINGIYQQLYQLVLNCREKAVVDIQLQWWRQQIADMYQKRASHPIAQVLQNTKELLQLPMQSFLTMIDASEIYINNPYLFTYSQVYNHFCQTTGIKEQLVANILGSTLPPEKINRMSCGIAITYHLIRLRQTLAKGHCFFATKELQVYDITMAQLTRGIMTNNILQFLQYQANRATLLLTDINNAPKPLKICAKISVALLKKLQRQHFKIFKQPIDLAPIYKLFLALKTH